MLQVRVPVLKTISDPLRGSDISRRLQLNSFQSPGDIIWTWQLSPIVLPLKPPPKVSALKPARAQFWRWGHRFPIDFDFCLCSPGTRRGRKVL